MRTVNTKNGKKQVVSVPILKLKAGGEKKQMTEPQWTGAVSSYARKYALQGLFGIGEKDVDEYPSDMNEPDQPKNKTKPKEQAEAVISVEKANYYLKEVAKISEEKGKQDGSVAQWFLRYLDVADYKQIKESQVEKADLLLNKLKGN